jgi:hypothetical protein
MEYTNITPVEFTMTCIVFTLYIVGKVWMYYRIEDNPNIKDTKKQTKTKVIRRGNEWD